jgi:hypothetical protein
MSTSLHAEAALARKHARRCPHAYARACIRACACAASLTEPFVVQAHDTCLAADQMHEAPPLVCARACAAVRARARACVRACGRACVRVCACASVCARGCGCACARVHLRVRACVRARALACARARTRARLHLRRSAARRLHSQVFTHWPLPLPPAPGAAWQRSAARAAQGNQPLLFAPAPFRCARTPTRAPARPPAHPTARTRAPTGSARVCAALPYERTQPHAQPHSRGGAGANGSAAVACDGVVDCARWADELAWCSDAHVRRMCEVRPPGTASASPSGAQQGACAGLM